MKNKFIILLAIVAGTALFAACNSNKTELSFTNSTSSTGAINDIVWANGDANWSTTGGYAESTTTEAKEVNETKGTVTCASDNAGDGNFIAASVLFENNSDSLILKDGSSNNYTLQAIQGAASKK